MRPQIFTALLLSAVFALGGAPRAQEERAPAALVVPIQGQIDMVTVRLIQRAVREASDRGIARVILDIDTPGGRVDAMREIDSVLSALARKGGAQITAYVRRNALSAGAYIALACQDLFMARGSTIGIITPIEIGPDGVRDIPDSDVRSKMLSAFRAEVRANVERRGNVSEKTLKLAEALVDPRMGTIYEVRYKDRDGFTKIEILDERELEQLGAQQERGDAEILSQDPLGNAPLTLTAEQAFQHRLCSGVYDSVEDFAVEHMGVRVDDIVRLEPSWSEEGVAWLQGIKPILFLIGFILLMIELKAPGLILPGLLGVLLISLGLFSSYLVGLADWTEILLFVLGLGMVAVEIFVMPGTIIFGLVGFVTIVLSLVLSNQSFIIPSTPQQHEILTGNLVDLLTLGVLAVGSAIVFYRVMPHIPFFNKTLLKPPEESSRTGDSTRFVGDDKPLLSGLLGMSGVAVTDLRPAGIFEIPDGKRFDVVSPGNFVARGAAVRVIAVDGNRIVVEPDVEGAEAAEGGGADSGEASISLLIFLMFLGCALIVAEVFFVSAGILTIAAVGTIGSAIFLAFTHHDAGTGMVFLVTAAIAAPASLAFAFKALPNTAIGRRLLLFGPKREEVAGAAEEAGLHSLLGQEGVTASALRPAGYARIGNQRVDVVTRGEMIERDTPVRVIEVEANRVVVAAGPAGTTPSVTNDGV